MNKCFFCGNTERPLTEEHVWPVWVSKLLRGKYGSDHFVHIRSTGNETTGLWRAPVLELERQLVRDRDREHTLRGSESRTLATVGAFRVVSSRDLPDHTSRPTDPRSGDLRHLRRAGPRDAVRRGLRAEGVRDVRGHGVRAWPRDEAHQAGCTCRSGEAPRNRLALARPPARRRLPAARRRRRHPSRSVDPGPLGHQDNAAIPQHHRRGASARCNTHFGPPPCERTHQSPCCTGTGAGRWRCSTCIRGSGTPVDVRSRT